jgi:hypothetical protein
MQDKMLSSVSGAILSIISMVAGVISVTSLTEAMILGLVGGTGGYLGKLLIDYLVGCVRVLKKNRQNNE